MPATICSSSPVSSRPDQNRNTLAIALAAALSTSLMAQTPMPVPGTVPVTATVNQSALTGMGPATPGGNFFDNTKGNLVRHQLSHISPIAIDPAIGAYLFAPNNAGQRLSITYLPTNTLVGEIPTGPGITAVVNRPGTAEAWAVDSINHCISVIDPIGNNIVRTIAVGKEPHGIAFLTTGARAYVTCSADSTVAVIDCASYSVAKTIQLPAITPRGITILNNEVWVAPFYSGNNTVAKHLGMPMALGLGDAGSQSVVNPNPALQENALDDADLLSITVTASPGTDVFDATRTVHGLGTILFNVTARAGTNELWIPNTEALNTTIGDANFIGGQVVRNRISIVDTSALNSQPVVIDLDAPSAAAGAGAAQPVAVVFDAPRDLAYVAAFGSDAILVLNTAASPPTVTGRYSLQPLTPPNPTTNTPARCGPRGMVMSADGSFLYVFNGIDNSYSRVDLRLSQPPMTTFSLGYDPTPAAVKRGIGHLANGDHSGTKTSSCMSCHIDGHLDMLMWNLSAFADPAPTSNPIREKDNKGPMATQSLRGLFEAGVLHWRGEQAGLDDFNQDGFVGLLKRSSTLATADFADLRAGTFSLVYPANPREPADRVYTGDALIGLDAFRERNADGVSCAACHLLPLGTNAEVQAFFTQAIPSHSGKVTQLRGVGDKVKPRPLPAIADYPLPWTVFTLPPTGSYTSTFITRSRNGFGLLHAGTVATLFDFVNIFPGLHASASLPDVVKEVAEFVDKFDTGLSPKTAFQFTVVPSSPTASVDFDTAANTITMDGAVATTQCDAVVAGAAWNGYAFQSFTMAWDHVLQGWQTGSMGALFSTAQLKQFTLNSGITVTFFGQPLGTGRRFGCDRDLDGLLDYDEALFTPFQASYVTNPDSDGDGFPDGHEALYSTGPTPMNPRTGPQASPDVTAPALTSPITVVYKSTTTAKLEFSTDEPTRAEVIGREATTSPTAGGFDVNHAIHIRGLPSATVTSVTVRITDINNRVLNQVVNIATERQGECSRVQSISPTFNPGTGIMTVTVTIGSFFGTQNLSGYAVEPFAYCRGASGGFKVINLSPVAANAAQQATFSFQIPQPVLGMATRTLFFGVRSINPPTPPPNGVAYFEAMDVTNFIEMNF